MNAAICDEIPADLTPVRTYAVTGVVEAVSCKAPGHPSGGGERRFRVSLIDYGAKRNIIRELQKRGCEVTVLPAAVSAEEILAAAPDGLMLSNGPRRPGGEYLSDRADSQAFGKNPDVWYLPWPPTDSFGRRRQHL